MIGPGRTRRSVARAIRAWYRRGMTTTQAPTYEELLAAFTQAMAHLDYCNWGDSWERSCAEDEGMIDDLKDTLQRATDSPPPAACTAAERAVLDASSKASESELRLTASMSGHPAWEVEHARAELARRAGR